MKKIISVLSMWAIMLTSVDAQNKVKVSMDNGAAEIYSSSSVESIDFGNDNNFSISFNNGDEKRSYNGNATQISFIKQTSIQEGGVKIVLADGWFESGFVIWEQSSDASDYSVYYKEIGGKYTKIDSELVRKSGSQFRADILGLKKGDYQFKVVPLIGGKEAEEKASETDIVTVGAFDRSGYAHFNYTEGVGAYKDDGTLKDDAIVVYVTEENKDNVTIPGYESVGKGIGWILNNNQYSSSSSNTYTADASKKGIFAVTKDHPVVIRFIGKVTSPEGLTAYNSTDNGGSVGDNGHLARMKNAQNLTLEGVGDDAQIYGWGFHFICSDNKYGKSFEARNLLFDAYPEDAIGMEGNQASSNVTSDLSASVERCWVHHCSFKQGYCANPAESDKKEGDGSCDFKRGQYFTLSYCYFEYGHKTNLIGSSDASLQFNITFHHNIWKNCASRVPLLRNANFHFYNNYVFGDMTDSKASLSYIASCRANSYRFSEHNYFDGCKNVCETTSGGASKSYGDLYYACIGTNNAVIAKTREEAVSNKCQFQARNIDFSKFDTDATLFYYDASKKQTKAYITDAVTARKECLMYSGVMKQKKVTNTSMNVNNVNGAIDMSSCKYDATMGTTGSGITFTNYKSGKFKGQGITFRIDRSCKVTVTAGSDSYGGPYLMCADGTKIGQLSGTSSYNIGAGTYFICSGSKDKESSVSALSFICVDDSEVSNKVDSNSGNDETSNGTQNNDGNGNGNGDNFINPDIDLTSDQTLTFDNGTTDNSGFFTVSANIKSGIAAKTYNGVTYTSAIKMESSTSVTFTTAAQKTLFIITDTANGKIKVDGTSVTADSDGVVSVSLTAGEHSISKGDSLNVYSIIIK